MVINYADIGKTQAVLHSFEHSKQANRYADRPLQCLCKAPRMVLGPDAKVPDLSQGRSLIYALPTTMAAVRRSAQSKEENKTTTHPSWCRLMLC